MAARSPYPLPTDSTGLSFLSPNLPHLSPNSLLLASSVTLPDSPLILYSVFQAPSEPASSHALSLIEAARKAVLQTNTSPSLLCSLLPSVHTGSSCASLYVFAITTKSAQSDLPFALKSLHLDGLDLVQSSSFSPSTLYPCSVACSSRSFPCPSCLHPPITTFNPPSPSSPTRPSSALLLPRQSLRRPLSQFLQAVRDHLVNDIVDASIAPTACGSYRPVLRLKDGFLLAPISVTNEWGSGWEHYSRQRPLIHCRLQIHLSNVTSPSRLLIHPILQPTHYIPLRNSLPIPSGTPIALLPHGVPAYYLSTYAGPTSALNSQFEDAFVGMGVGTWKVNNPPLKGGSAETIHAYVIAWLAVQNKQGEDKGLPIIWPSALCLSYFPGTPSAHARATLKCIPELPSQLQASPPAPASFVPFSEPSANHDVQEDDSPMSTTSTSGPFSSQKIGTPVESNHLFSPFRRRQGTNYPKRPAFLSRSPTSDSLMALKTLTLSGASESIQSIAPEVSGFVEAVARERELQRERIKRERENVAKSNSSSLAKHSSVTLQPPKVRDGVQSVPTIPVPGPSVRPVVQGLPTPSAKAEQDTIFPPPGIPDIPEATPSTILPEPEVSETPVKMETSPVNTPAPSMPLPIPDPMSTSFEDAFGGFDTPWPQNGNGFMNLSYDMDFNMNLDTIGGDTGNAGNPSTDFDIDDGFGVFTDDDFNVFDDPAESKPQVAATVSVGRNVSIPSGLVSSSGPPLGLSPPNLGDTLHISGPGPPSAGLSQPSTWGTHQLGDIFTPHPDSIPPELLPPSPGKTPSSYSAPATPLASLQFSETPDPIISSRRKSFQSGLGPNDFGPIPFAASHRIADGKYAIGKFSLPSPPDEEDRTEAYGRPWLSASYPDVKGSDWQDRYKLVTDPRVGVVRKLVGVKRRREVQGGRPLDASPRWSREYEEWEDTSVQAEEPKSESDDDEDDTWVDEEDSVPNAPRPVTPPPSYLPLGPTLLQTYFQHRHLLPLSMPLRLPGSVVNNSSNLPAPISVPTPVSPAAILGAASEKTKSLEAAAQILVREIVENRVWADAWRVNSTAASVSTKPPAEVRQFDAMSVLSLLRKLPTEHGTLDLKTLYGGPQVSSDVSKFSVQLMSSPMFSVGKSGIVTNVLPTALRFWDKLGLSPRSGKKDVTAFVFFEGNDEHDEDRVVAWFDRLSDTYTSKHFGSHTAGRSSNCTRDGTMPIHFDSCRKTVTSFVSSLLPTTDNLVFYVITPSSIVNMSSPSLRQVLSAIKKVLKTHVDTQILFQLVPESLIPATHDSTKDHSGLDDLAASVYDRILHPVDRVTARSLGNLKGKVRDYFQSPAFTLARPLPGKVKFLREPHATTLDVVDRESMLHVGYHVTPCGKWILAACIDQRGDVHDLKAWLVPDESSDSFVVMNVWGFVSGILIRASVQWRVSITKLGVMDPSELDAWISHLETTAVPSPHSPPMQVAILSAEHDNGWTFVPPEHSTSNLHSTPLHRNSKASQGSIYADASSSTYGLFPTTRIPLISEDPREGHAESPCILEEDGQAHDRDISVLPLQTSILAHVPADTDFTTISMLQLHMLHVHHTPDLVLVSPEEDILKDITRNFYELSILTRARWRLKAKPVLPFQLSALEVMHTALDREDANLD